MKLFVKPIAAIALCAPTRVVSENVTVETFVRAESDENIRSQMGVFGYGVEKPHHLRGTISRQFV